MVCLHIILRAAGCPGRAEREGQVDTESRKLVEGRSGWHRNDLSCKLGAVCTGEIPLSRHFSRHALHLYKQQTYN